MRCHICNAILTPGEIQYNKDHQDFDPCGRCLDAVDEVFNDRTEDEIDAELQNAELVGTPFPEASATSDGNVEEKSDE